MATCSKYSVQNNKFVDNSEMSFTNTFHVTMFVDAISFSSAHIVKIKDQTIVIPAKNYLMSVG